MLKGKIHLHGKLVETILLFENIEAFAYYIETIEEHYDEGSTNNHETVISSETDRKIIEKIKRNAFGTEYFNFDTIVLIIQGRNCYIPGEQVNCLLFFMFCFDV